jgi:hypothetical protein
VGVNFRDDTICRFIEDLVGAIPGTLIEDPCEDMRRSSLNFVANALDSINGWAV